MFAGGLCCKRCGGLNYVKSGTVRGHQRHCLPRVRLQRHPHVFTGQAACDKALAVLLYGMGGMSFSMIGRLLG